ncbi:MAG: hypothetical protein ABIE07_09240 [Candidatus Zixiibacteriota bacterium]
MRDIFKNLNYKTESTSFYHAHFAIQDSGQTFTGDSIGLAAGLLAYTQLMRPDISRVDRFLSAEITCTGGIDKSGRISKVNDDSLKYKIERAFFSPVKYLVLPEINYIEANNYLKKLNQKYPRRNLIIIGLNKFSDAIENRNILRDEKVCIGEYVTKKAIKYSRAARIQVPLLFALVWILAAIFWPRYFDPWFDKNPAFAQANPQTNTLDAYNRDSILLWSDTLLCKMSENTSDFPFSTSFGQIIDMNDDGLNEVVFLPRIDDICDDRTRIRFYSQDGQLLFKRNAAVLDKYPRDTLGTIFDPVYFATVNDYQEQLIISIVGQEMPARSHIRIWDRKGDSLGWFINWGHGTFQKAMDINGDNNNPELFFLCFNNSMEGTALLILDKDSAFGFSPYKDCPIVDSGWYTHGNQLAYIVFPTTDIGQLENELPMGYNQPGPHGIQISENGNIKIYISESVKHGFQAEIIYTLNHDLRVINVYFNDFLNTRRKELVAEGKLPPIENWSEYLTGLMNAVIYWTDFGWVTGGQLRAEE